MIWDLAFSISCTPSTRIACTSQAMADAKWLDNNQKTLDQIQAHSLEALWPGHWWPWPVEKGRDTTSGYQVKEEVTHMKGFYMKALYINCFDYSFHLHYMSFSTLPLGRNEANLRLIGTNAWQLPIACFHVLWRPQPWLLGPQASGMAKRKCRWSSPPLGTLDWLNTGNYWEASCPWWQGELHHKDHHHHHHHTCTLPPPPAGGQWLMGDTKPGSLASSRATLQRDLNFPQSDQGSHPCLAPSPSLSCFPPSLTRVSWEMLINKSHTLLTKVTTESLSEDLSLGNLTKTIILKLPALYFIYWIF